MLYEVFLFALSIAPAAAILGYYLYVVRLAPEPWRRVVASCTAGMIAYFVAATLEPGMSLVVPRSQPWLWAFFVVAPIEEGLKLLAVLVAAPLPTRYERLSSGLMYGVAAGVGFACVENVRYVFDYGATIGMLRAITAVPAHALHSALVGIALGAVHRTTGVGRRLLLVAFGLVAAIVMHAVYDGLLLGGGVFRGLIVLLLAAELAIVRGAVRGLLERDLRRDMDRLAAIPLLDGVPTACLRVIAGGATRQRVVADHAVVRQGRPGDALFVILKGRLDVQIDGRHVDTLHTGDFFGEQSVLTGAPRTADVISTEESRLLRVRRPLLLRAVANHPELAELLIDRARSRFLPGVIPSPYELLEAATEMAAATELDGLARRLAEVRLLVGLPPDDFRSLAQACVPVFRAAQRRVVRAGRSGPGLCLLLSGEAEVRLQSGDVSLVEGDFFGEIHLLTGWPATATVRAATPVELAVLRWVDLQGVVARNPDIGWRLLVALASRSKGESALASDEGDRALRAFRPLRPRRLSLVLGAEASAEPGVDRLYRAFAELRSLPAAVAETLSRIAVPVARPDPDASGLYIGSGGALQGVLGAFPVPGHEVGPWWRLSEDAILDGVARCPDVLRFLARLTLGGRRRAQVDHLP